MIKRVGTKIGDVFSVRINDTSKKYFQLIAYDLTQLNSDVIRAFSKEYPLDIKANLEEIVNGEIEFYAHCITKFGIKMNLWEKEGNTKEVGNIEQILFRDTNDYGSKVGEKPISISNQWYVWRIGEKFKDIGKLTGDNKKAEIGIVVNPHDVVERMKTGEYSFFYPSFE